MKFLYQYFLLILSPSSSSSLLLLLLMMMMMTMMICWCVSHKVVRIRPKTSAQLSLIHRLHDQPPADLKVSSRSRVVKVTHLSLTDVNIMTSSVSSSITR